jgi:tRNA threonylcarbamoyl adenosine modification protein YeaZ
LDDGERLLAEQTILSENQHTTYLTALIQEMFTALKCSPQDLTAVAISQGPGSFSGLRVGFGVAKGLCTARSIPLIAVPTLEVVAASTPPLEEHLLAIIPAGRRRIITGEFHWEGESWRADGDPINTDWESLLSTITQHTLINGEIEPAGLALLTQSERPVRFAGMAWAPRRAGFLAALSRTRSPQSPALVNPIYLKEP